MATTDSTKVVRASSYFRWNTINWFVIQGLISAWIVVAAVLLKGDYAPISVTLFALAVIYNIGGWMIWRNRTRISPHRGLQVLLLSGGLFSLVGWAAIYLFYPDIVQMIRISFTVGAALHLAFPMLMLGIFGLESWSYRRRFHNKGAARVSVEVPGR